jgi:hypothetical protein
MKSRTSENDPLATMETGICTNASLAPVVAVAVPVAAGAAALAVGAGVGVAAGVVPAAVPVAVAGVATKTDGVPIVTVVSVTWWADASWSSSWRNVGALGSVGIDSRSVSSEDCSPAMLANCDFSETSLAVLPSFALEMVATCWFAAVAADTSGEIPSDHPAKAMIAMTAMPPTTQILSMFIWLLLS